MGNHGFGVEIRLGPALEFDSKSAPHLSGRLPPGIPSGAHFPPTRLPDGRKRFACALRVPLRGGMEDPPLKMT